MRSRRPSSGTLPAVTGSLGAGEPFTVETSSPRAGLIMTLVAGTIGSACLVRMRYQLTQELAATVNGSYDWIIDASGLDKIEREVSEHLLETLKTFKLRGGSRLIVAITNNGIRMMLASIGMTSIASGGPGLELVATMNEALQRLGKADG